MAAPKRIRAKAEQLSRALDTVSRLAEELERWYATKTDDYLAMDFFHDCNLDNPYEYDLQEVLDRLDEVSGS